MILDEEIEGATNDFDVIEMDNQTHEYIEMPKVTKVPVGLIKNVDLKMKIRRSDSSIVTVIDPQQM